ncbi:MAG: hypothetical protein OXU88_08675, partial [Gammaproteobacteria bacterium]|nr:hypothetical protein [Gammaproteobacteria bacterium]
LLNQTEFRDRSARTICLNMKLFIHTISEKLFARLYNAVVMLLGVQVSYGGFVSSNVAPAICFERNQFNNAMFS